MFVLIGIGVVIGFVMGLTGAGGALVAIPLFMQFLSMSLKEASVYSLVAVVMASFSNFYYQRKNAHLALASLFVIFSGVGSFLSQPYKAILPEAGIALLLALIATYSLYSVWRPSPKTQSSQKPNISPVKTIVLGLFLGVLTTFTGLGGGVLMLPILLGLYRLPQAQAVATSLVVVGLSSLLSFLIQIFRGNSRFDFDGLSFLGLLLGLLATSYLLKIMIAKVSLETASTLRKVVFTLVVVIALVRIF